MDDWLTLNNFNSILKNPSDKPFLQGDDFEIKQNLNVWQRKCYANEHRYLLPNPIVVGLKKPNSSLCGISVNVFLGIYFSFKIRFINFFFKADHDKKVITEDDYLGGLKSFCLYGRQDFQLSLMMSHKAKSNIYCLLIRIKYYKQNSYYSQDIYSNIFHLSSKGLKLTKSIAKEVIVDKEEKQVPQLVKNEIDISGLDSQSLESLKKFEIIDHAAWLLTTFS